VWLLVDLVACQSSANTGVQDPVDLSTNDCPYDASLLAITEFGGPEPNNEDTYHMDEPAQIWFNGWPSGTVTYDSNFLPEEMWAPNLFRLEFSLTVEGIEKPIFWSENRVGTRVWPDGTQSVNTWFLSVTPWLHPGEPTFPDEACTWTAMTHIHWIDSERPECTGSQSFEAIWQPIWPVGDCLPETPSDPIEPGPRGDTGTSSTP